jgi:hypothetical protein
VTPCSLVDKYRRFRITCCFHQQGRQKDYCPGDGSISLVSVKQATRRHVLEDCNLNIAALWTSYVLLYATRWHQNIFCVDVICLLCCFVIFEDLLWIRLSKAVMLSLSTPWERAEGVRLQLHSFFRRFPSFWYLLYSFPWWEHDHNDRQIFGTCTKVLMFAKWTSPGNSMTVCACVRVERS